MTLLAKTPTLWIPKKSALEISNKNIVQKAKPIFFYESSKRWISVQNILELCNEYNVPLPTSTLLAISWWDVESTNALRQTTLLSAAQVIVCYDKSIKNYLHTHTDLRAGDICHLLSLSHSTLGNLLTAGIFPPPSPLAPSSESHKRHKVWNVQDIFAWAHYKKSE